MPPKSRARVCTVCHALKIKCELSLGEDAPPCARCLRLGKDCTIVTPRRQKDRIADLEAKIEELSRLLAAQTIPTANQEDDQSHVSSKKRKLETKSIPNLAFDAAKENLTQAKASGSIVRIRDTYSNPGHTPEPGSRDLLSIIDSKMSLALQEHVLRAYVDGIVRFNPFVPLSKDITLEKIRRDAPTVLLCILAFPTMGILNGDLQTDLTQLALSEFAGSLVADGNRSLELVDALLIAVFWARMPPRHRSQGIYQLMQLAASVAVDIGIAGPQSALSLAAGQDDFNPTSIEAKRCWLGCFACASSISLLMRRSMTCKWTSYHQECLQALDSSPERLGSDSLLYQMIRAEQICYVIAEDVLLCDSSLLKDVSDPATKTSMQNSRRRIDGWVAQVPKELRVPSLLTFWQNLMGIYLNEIVLHTASNKTTFAAPFLPAHLAPGDFAAPVVTDMHVTTLHALKDSCHGLLDAAMEFTVEEYRSMSPLIYAPRVLYAMFILAKLYIALSGEGSTYATVMGEAELNLENYFKKLKSIDLELDSIDATAYQARLIRAVSELDRWYSAQCRATSSSCSQTTADQLSDLPPLDNGYGLDFKVDEQLDCSAWGDGFFTRGPDDYLFGDMFADLFRESA